MQFRSPFTCSRIAGLLLACGLCCGGLVAQSAPDTTVPPALPAAPVPATVQTVPDAPTAAAMPQTSEQSAADKEAARIAALGSINGRKYDQPSNKDQFLDYLRDSYGLPAMARSTIRTLYSFSLDKPAGWGQDLPGFMQRFGSNAAITAIDGSVRYGMETLFHEDMRYIACHGCSVRRKIQNALLSEVTARHDVDGHRFFTLTPAIADFSGPIIANTFWYPNHDPFGGVVGTRTVAATRIGSHLFTEFVLEHRHKDPKLEDHQNDPNKPLTPQPHP